jgi:hypothetical protein
MRALLDIVAALACLALGAFLLGIALIGFGGFVIQTICVVGGTAALLQGWRLLHDDEPDEPRVGRASRTSGTAAPSETAAAPTPLRPREVVAIAAGVLCGVVGVVLVCYGSMGLITLPTITYFDTPWWFFATLYSASLICGIAALLRAWPLIRDKRLL